MGRYRLHISLRPRDVLVAINSAPSNPTRKTRKCLAPMHSYKNDTLFKECLVL